MAYTRPVQVFTDIKTHRNPSREFILPSEHMLKSSKNSAETVTLTALDRQINVNGVGELEQKPDRFSMTIKCRASKDNVQDAKTSVTRRLDYIIQTLKNNYLKDEDYKVYQHVNYQEAQAVYECEIEANFFDIGKCLSVSNLLVEKLGPGVSISLPVCYHAIGTLDKLRKQAGMLAIHNARQKAMEMAKVIHMSVGAAVKIEEQGFSETQGSPLSDLEELDLTPGVQQRVAERTVRISSKVTVCFQLKVARKKNSQRS